MAELAEHQLEIGEDLDRIVDNFSESLDSEVLHGRGGLVFVTPDDFPGWVRYSRGILPIEADVDEGRCFVGLRQGIGAGRADINEMVLLDDGKPETLRDAGAGSVLLSFRDAVEVRLQNGERPSAAALAAGKRLVALMAESSPQLDPLPEATPRSVPSEADLLVGTIVNKHTGERWFKPMPV